MLKSIIFFFFLPISVEMYSLFWPHMTVHSKIYIFGFVTLNLKTCIELETILAIMVKQVGVEEHEICKIKCNSLIMYKEYNTTSSISNQFYLFLNCTNTIGNSCSTKIIDGFYMKSLKFKVHLTPIFFFSLKRIYLLFEILLRKKNLIWINPRFSAPRRNLENNS